jgi:hypothetical protein|tara:strand:- start:665 stop:868 length:204 start_codon:yes stop_codon:yes gene_type:complete
MAKFKLHKDVAGAKSFRYNGNKYETRTVDQKTLKKLHKDGFEYVIEIKESKKSATKNEKKEVNNGDD